MKSTEWTLSQRTQDSLATVDVMPRELRNCVHELGLTVVNACLQAGVTKPNRIRQLVHQIWEGARHEQQGTGAGYKSAVMLQLDWLLMQAGAQISAQKLVGFLRMHSWTMIPMHPTKPMMEASMTTVSEFNERITKREKHQRRLIAAIDAGSKSLFPQFYKNEQLQAQIKLTEANLPVDSLKGGQQ